MHHSGSGWLAAVYAVPPRAERDDPSYRVAFDISRAPESAALNQSLASLSSQSSDVLDGSDHAESGYLGLIVISTAASGPRTL